MTLSSHLMQGSVWVHKLFQMANQEWKAEGSKYQMWPDFWIILKGARGAQSFKCLLKVVQFLLCWLNAILPMVTNPS